MIDANEMSPALDEQVFAALAESPYFRRHKLRCETQEGRVILRGKVGSFYQKQMAQETLRRVDGVEHIENLLEVNLCELPRL